MPATSTPWPTLAKRHGLRLLYDAAHAFGCSHAGRMIGNFGDAEVFSFHATKFLNSGEGGAIVTNDDDLAERSDDCGASDSTMARSSTSARTRK